MSLVKETFFEYCLERPPLRFDVLIVICYVGVLHVGPVTDAVAHLLPFGFIFPNGFFAFLDERLYAVLFYLFFTVKPEKLFDFKLYGQAVCIPAGFSEHIIALHRLKARYYILHTAREDVADMGLAVCCRRPVVEGVRLFAACHFDALFEYLVLFPELEHFFFS